MVMEKPNEIGTGNLSINCCKKGQKTLRRYLPQKDARGIVKRTGEILEMEISMKPKEV
jgi:hypothetical protein